MGNLPNLQALIWSPHLSYKRDEIKMRDYMGRRVTPPKRVISPTWGPHLHVNRPLACDRLSESKDDDAQGCALFASLGTSKKGKRKKKLTEGNVHSGTWDM